MKQKLMEVSMIVGEVLWVPKKSGGGTLSLVTDKGTFLLKLKEADVNDIQASFLNLNALGHGFYRPSEEVFSSGDSIFYMRMEKQSTDLNKVTDDLVSIVFIGTFGGEHEIGRGVFKLEDIMAVAAASPEFSAK